MPFFNCPVCGKLNSVKYTKCPKCGTFIGDAQKNGGVSAFDAPAQTSVTASPPSSFSAAAPVDDAPMASPFGHNTRTVHAGQSERQQTPPQLPAAAPVAMEPKPEMEKQTATVAQRPKFCPECGARLSESGSFCGNCGTRIPVANPIAVATNTPPTKKNPYFTK